jgi:acyl-CoA synthetase (NDP forming)
MKTPPGRKAVVLGIGGGATVQAADECYQAGLILPALPGDIREELKKFTPIAGDIFRNPVDISGNTLNPSEIGHAIKVVGNLDSVDLLIIHFGFQVGPGAPPQLMVPVVSEMLKAVKEVGKPTALAVYAAYSPQACQTGFEVQKMCTEARIPLFPSILRAANAIDKLMSRNQAL